MGAADVVDGNFVAHFQLTCGGNADEDGVAIVLEVALHGEARVARCLQLAECGGALVQRQVLYRGCACDGALCGDGDESCSNWRGGGIAKFQRATVDGDG